MDAELDPKDKALLQDIQAFNREYAVSGWHLQDKLVKEDLSREFELKNASPGRYAFRIIYGATEPSSGSSRPVLIVNSVELKE